MPIANFDYTIHLYGDNITVEDWLAHFYVEQDEVVFERYPKSDVHRTTSTATFLPTMLGNLEVTREQLVALFSEEEVAKEELRVALAHLEDLGL